MTQAAARPQLAHLTAVLERSPRQGHPFQAARARRPAGAGLPLRRQRGHQPGQQQLPWPGQPSQAHRGGHRRHAQAFGVGSGAVRTIAGTMRIHMELEEKIARFKNVEACVVFQSGFAANAGTVSAILGKEDFILSDELNHASIIDGARLSRATIKVFRHKDVAHCEELLQELADAPGHKLVITDGVFSMDGDIGPVDKLAALAEKYGAIMMVDDAHASGVLGRNGRGSVDHFGMHGKVDVQVGTLSKAIGALGGYVCGIEGSDRLPLPPRPPVSVLHLASAERSRPHASRPSTSWSGSRSASSACGRTRVTSRASCSAPASTSAASPRRPPRRPSRRSSSARPQGHGLLARAVRRRRDGHGHRVPDRSRGQGAHPHDPDQRAHQGATRPGAGNHRARGQADGDSTNRTQ